MSPNFSLLTVLVAVVPTLALLDAGLSHDQLAGIRQQLKDTAHARSAPFYISSFRMLSACRSCVIGISESPWATPSVAIKLGRGV